jgi:DNA-binding response OmpR family regulator
MKEPRVLVINIGTTSTCMKSLQEVNLWRVTHTSVQQSIPIIKKQYIDLFCIESDHFNQQIAHLLTLIKDNSLKSNILAIIPNERDIKKLFLKYGTDDYLCKPYNCEDLILRCKKLTQCLSLNYSAVYEKSSIRYERKFNRVMYKNTYIPLTPTESIIMQLLIKQPIITQEEIKKYLETKFGKKYSEKYITVIIYRIRKKVKLSTGRDLIRNKYGSGYYIV